MNVIFRKKVPSKENANNGVDDEVDGFVMIGETTAERETVKPGDVINNELPPMYSALKGTSSVINPPTTRTGVTANQQLTTTDVKAQSNNTISATADCYQAVSDVPFQFDASVSRSLQHAQFMEDMSYAVHNITSGFESEYSFHKEYDVLNSPI